MHAHHVVELTGPPGLRWVEVPEPDTTAQLVVEVMAAGVSFADLLYTQGRYQVRPTLPFAPGMDAAGVVRSAPPGSGFEAGQRVAVLAAYGCWQDVITADPSGTLPLQDDMGFEAGAAAPLNYLTSLFALVRRGQAQPGEVLLVHGAAGGVGAAAIQVGRALGLTTVAVTFDEGKRAFAAGCGADHAVCGANWREAVREIVGAAGVDLALDPVGGDRLVDSLRLLAPEGRLLVVGFTAGEIPTVKVNRLLLGNIGVLGAASREFFERQPAVMAELWTQYLDLRKTGSAGRGMAVCRRAPGPASRRTPTQPRQERTEPPYVASEYDATRRAPRSGRRLKRRAVA
jgi:NADPH2:quinone reductase